MGNMGAMAGLWRQIQNEMRDAVSEAESKTFLTANQELTASYAGGEPIPPEQGGYVRTYQMKNSARTTGVVGGGDSVSATVYLDHGYNYNTGTYSTPHVFSEAESGGSGIVLTSGFWQRTEQKAQQYAEQAFAKRFKQ